MPILDQYGNPISSKPPTNKTPSPVLGLDSRWHSYPLRGLTPQRLAKILREADDGYLETQAELFAEMEERDGTLLKLMQDRRLASIGLEWRVEPKDGSAEAKRYADAFNGAWTDMPSRQLLLELLDALGQGVSMVGLAWERSDGLWHPARFEHIEAKFLTYDFELKRFKIRTQEQPMGVLPQYGQVVEHRYRARAGSPTRAGLMRTLAWWYLFKHYAVKDWVTYGELYGQPFRLGKYDPATGKDERDALEAAVRSLGTDAAGVISKNTEIEIIETGQRGGPDVYEKLISLANREMTLAVLGQTLTSSEGQHGTQALGQVHLKTRADLLEADTLALGETLREQLVKPFVAFNFGPEHVKLAPKVRAVVAEERDQKERAETLDILQQMGTPIPESYIQQEFGLPAPQTNERILIRPSAQRPAPLEAARVSLESARPSRGVLNGQQYVFELLGQSLNLGSEAMKDPLDLVLEQVRQADGYDDLRRRLVRLFPQLDVSQLSRLLEVSLSLSELAGMLAQREDAHA